MVRHAKALAETYSKLFRLHNIKAKDLKTRLYQHYIGKLEKLEPVQIASAIKCSLAVWVARRLRQNEMPEKKIGYFKDFFPKSLKKILHEKTNICRTHVWSQKYALRFIWSIAQAKRNCADVSDDDVEKQLNSFKELVFSQGQSDSETEQQLFELGKEFGKYVQKHYDPTILSYPGDSSTLEYTKKQGGTKAFIKDKMLDRNFREEPFCILISGEPGIGKTTLNKKIVEYFSERLNLDTSKELVYTRTCNTEHWDGYNGQFFTIMDDFGQNTDYKDVIELITLVSSNHYVLPMAKLEEKGMKFSSSIIILNTNQSNIKNFQFGNPVESTVYDKTALFRRFHASIRLQARKSDFYTLTYNRNGLDWIAASRTSLGRFSDSEQTIRQKDLIIKLFSDFTQHGGKWMLEGGISDTYSQFGQIFKKERMSHWVSTTDFPCQYDVKPIGLKEPLKVRVITKGPASHAVMGNFQKSLWKALRDFDPETFALTYGKTVQELDTSIEDHEQYMSIDYTSSTDCIYQNATESLLRGILENIDHAPTKRYALSGLKAYIDGQQTTRGQMMGWRLSFPLLCLINYYVVKKSGFRKFFINGDDCLAIGTKENIDKFNVGHRSVGFEKSIGKNFISNKFGTINSQLVYKGTYVPYYNLLVLKRDDTYQTFSEAQKAFNLPLIVKENRDWLKRTPLSLDIDKQHGGIGLKSDWTKEKKRDRAIYLIKILEKLNKPHVTTRGKYYLHPEGKPFPVDTYENFLDRSDTQKEHLMTITDYIRLYKKYRKVKGFKEFVKRGSLMMAPKLSFGYLPVKKSFDIKNYVTKSMNHTKRFVYQLTTKDQIDGLLKVRKMIHSHASGQGAEIRAN